MYLMRRPPRVGPTAVPKNIIPTKRAKILDRPWASVQSAAYAWMAAETVGRPEDLQFGH